MPTDQYKFRGVYLTTGKFKSMINRDTMLHMDDPDEVKNNINM